MSSTEKTSISTETTAIIERSATLEEYVIKVLSIFEKYPQFQVLVIQDYNNCQIEICRNGLIEAKNLGEEKRPGYIASLVFITDKAVERYRAEGWKDTETARIFRRRQDYDVEKYLQRIYATDDIEDKLVFFEAFIGELLLISDKLPEIPTQQHSLLFSIQTLFSDEAWRALVDFSKQKNGEFEKEKKKKSGQQSSHEKNRQTIQETFYAFFNDVDSQQIVRFLFILSALLKDEKEVVKFRQIVKPLLNNIDLVSESAEEIYLYTVRNIQTILANLDKLAYELSKHITPDELEILKIHMQGVRDKMDKAA